MDLRGPEGVANLYPYEINLQTTRQIYFDIYSNLSA